MAESVLTSMTLGNFRAFSDEVDVPFGQITLLYGQNSAGKSSVIKALLMLQQTFRDTLDRSRQSFVFSGDAVDLGAFSTSVFGHDVTREMSFGVNLAYRETRGRGAGGTQVLSSGGFTWWLSNDDGVRGVEVRLNGSSFRFSRIQDGRRTFFVLHPDDLEAWCRTVASDQTLFSDADEALADLRLGAGFLPVFSGALSPSRFQGCAIMPSQRRSGSQRGDLGLKRYGREDVEDLEDFTVSSGGTTLGAAWERLFRPLERELRVFTRTLSHLGPLRQEPKRLERYTPTSDRNVGSSGEDMLSLMYDKPFLVTEVNNYLGLMNLPYRLRVVSLSEANPVGSFIYLGLTNRSTDLELSPSDVGVGYSQVLPLIAQSVLSRDSLVCVEQPELHLHPAMQAELGDMFIGQALSGNRVQFLIETHSESLMLRLLRRVREGRIDASRIKVLYVDQLPAGNSEIVELPILPSGEFARPWPHGFFDERLQEFGF